MSTISISDASHQLLKEMAEKTAQSMEDIVDRALDAYRRKIFFDQLDSGYAELRADPEAWRDHLAERKTWEATLMDGLDPSERWTEDGRCVSPEENND